jgi:spore coat protein U-like protein
MHVRRAVRILVAVMLTTWAIGVTLAGAPAAPFPQPDRPARIKPNKSCEISASGVDFGAYDTLNGTPTDATGSVTYVCRSKELQKSVPVIITIDQGRAGSFNRAMTGAAEPLGYNLYVDVGRTRIWGDGSGGTVTLQDSVAPNGKANTVAVYGRVVPRQNVSAGRYSDGLVVTIQF